MHEGTKHNISDCAAILRTLSEKIVTEAEVIFFDFDHTLFAANSTELFISSCRPKWLVALIEFSVRKCVPWRLLRPSLSCRVRDLYCVRFLLLLTPWNMILWRRRAPDLYERLCSRELSDVLTLPNMKNIVIISFGFEFIIRELLAGSALESITLIATNLSISSESFTGKREMAENRFGAEAIANCVFITDSIDDKDLISASRLGIIIEPQGDLNKSSDTLYLPLRYVVSAKYPAKYVLDQIVFVDLALVICSNSESLDHLLKGIICVPFFLISLMCIYEIGYFENDMYAAKKEDFPVLSEQSARFQSYPINSAWGWSIILGIAGVFAKWDIDGYNESIFQSLAYWITGLVIIRILFYVYNRAQVNQRVFFYGFLQLAKYIPYTLIFGATETGIALLAAQVICMWGTYIVYRLGGKKDLFDRDKFRLCFFLVVFSFSNAAGLEKAHFFEFNNSIIIGWLLIRVIRKPVTILIRKLRAVVERGFSYSP